MRQVEQQAVVEEYVEGIELSVDAYGRRRARVLSISTSEKIADGDKFVIFRGNHPAEGIDAYGLE